MGILNTPPANSAFEVSDDLSEDWTVIEVFNTEFDASVARGALEAEGIPVMMTGQMFGSVLPIGFNSIGGISLWVPTDRANEAAAILKRNRD